MYEEGEAAVRQPVERVLDLTGDEVVSIAPLVEAVAAGDVDAGTLTDEELHWVAGDVDASPDPYLDAPRLGQLSEHDQDVALETAMWLLQARGDATLEGGGIRLRGRHAMIGELRGDAEAAVSVRVDVRGEGVARAAIYRIRADVYLTEDVAEVGLHRFTFCAPERQAAWLAGMVDPHGVAQESAPPRTAATVAGLGGEAERLAEQATTSALVFAGERLPGGKPLERSVTGYGTQQGFFVLHGLDDGAGPVTVQRLGPGDLVRLCAQLLLPPASGRSGH